MKKVKRLARAEDVVALEATGIAAISIAIYPYGRYILVCDYTVAGSSVRHVVPERSDCLTLWRLTRGRFLRAVAAGGAPDQLG